MAEAVNGGDGELVETSDGVGQTLVSFEALVLECRVADDGAEPSVLGGCAAGVAQRLRGEAQHAASAFA